MKLLALKRWGYFQGVTLDSPDGDLFSFKIISIMLNYTIKLKSYISLTLPLLADFCLSHKTLCFLIIHTERIKMSEQTRFDNVMISRVPKGVLVWAALILTSMATPSVAYLLLKC